MAITPRTGASGDLVAGAVWVIEVQATDSDGCPVTDTVVVTVTLPDDTTDTPTVTDLGNGVYRAEHTTTDPGRYVATATGAYGAAAFTVYAGDPVAAADMPTIADLDAYLGSNSYSDDQLQDVLDAEAAAQRRACRVPAVYTSDLREALLRRCARNLAMRRVPLSILQGDADAGTTSAYPGRDSEIRRLEGGYKKLKVG